MRLVAVRYLALGPLLLAADPSTAEACSAPACWPGVLTPNEATPVPANLPGIYWRPLSGANGVAGTDPANVVLATAAAPDTELPFTTTALEDGAFLIVPTQPLVDGTSYVVNDLNTCDGSGTGPSASFAVGPSAPLPIALGSVAVTYEAHLPTDVPTSSGSCSTEVFAHLVGLTPTLIAEALPWTAVFHFEVLVDGAVWQTTDSINTQPSPRGTWQLYHSCASGDVDPGAHTGLSQGAHTVAVRATIPGTSTVLLTEEITVEMSCDTGIDGPEGGGPSDDGGCQAASGPATSWLALAIVGMIRALTGRRRRRSAREAR
jgi:hypothetical protein